MARLIPADRKYSIDHEWVFDNGDGTATVGITDYAQEMLTDVVFVELPPVGKKVKKSQTLAIVESVKSVSEVYAPVSGEVAAVNRALEEHPELVNQDALGAGWLVRLVLADRQELAALMDAADYEALIGKESH